MTICVYGCENGIKFVGDGKNQIPCKCADGQAAVFAKPGGGTFTGAEFHDDWKNNA